MFTGIVEEVGTVTALRPAAGSLALDVACVGVLADATVGGSIAVDGCCLTMESVAADGFSATVIAETARRTTLASLAVRGAVNLERPLAASGRFDGHIVQGHVDGVGEVVTVEDLPGERVVAVRAPDAVARYVVAKGSVTLAGVSLTVVDVERTGVFTVALIPHTLEATTLGRLKRGDLVNLEADVIAKYVERALAAGGVTPYA